MILGKHKEEFIKLKRLALTLACFVDDTRMKLALRSHFPHVDVEDVALFSFLQNCAAMERRYEGPVDPIMSRLPLGPRRDYLTELLDELIADVSKINYPIGIYEIRQLDRFTTGFLKCHFGERCKRGQASMRSLVIDSFFECFDEHKKKQDEFWSFRPTNMPSIGIEQNFVAHIANIHGRALREKGDPDYAEFEEIELFELYRDEESLAKAVDCIFHDDFSSTYEPPPEAETNKRMDNNF